MVLRNQCSRPKMLFQQTLADRLCQGGSSVPLSCPIIIIVIRSNFGEAESHAAAGGGAELLAVGAELPSRPVPIPDALIKEMLDEQVLEFFNLGASDLLLNWQSIVAPSNCCTGSFTALASSLFGMFRPSLKRTGKSRS